jgi:hypothetical protein
MRKIMGIMMAGLMLLAPMPVTAASGDLGHRVAAIPVGAMVEVRLQDNEKARGRRGDVTTDALVLQPAPGGTAVERRIALADVRSVREIKSHTGRHVLTGLVIGLVAGAAVFYGVLYYIYTR